MIELVDTRYQIFQIQWSLIMHNLESNQQDLVHDTLLNREPVKII